jgi:hypothetical protein
MKHWHKNQKLVFKSPALSLFYIGCSYSECPIFISNTRFMKKSFLLFVLCILLHEAQAQKKATLTQKDYTKTPMWIAMMDDPNVNFFEIEKAYERYWSKHEKPEGEDEEIGEHAERQKTPSKRKQRKISAANDLKFAVKKYEVWRDQTLPYVQPDGRILSAEERLQIWKAQQQQH